MDYAALERTTLLVDVASGFLFLTLGAWVLTLTPRRLVTIALGTFAAGLGIHVALSNLREEFGWSIPTAAEAVALAAAGSSLTALAWLFPRPLRAGERWRLLCAPLALSVLAVVITVIGTPEGAEGRARQVYGRAFPVPLFALALFAVRFPRAESREERAALAVVTLALGVEVGLRTGISVSAAAVGHAPPAVVGVACVAAMALTALWLLNTRRGAPEDRRVARDLALLFPALLFAGALFAASTDPTRATNLGPMGLARIAGVLLLAWAILRGILPGVDARVRWGISKSTVAAVFVAVFFVGSEAAQQFFGESLGSSYIGIAAAGALVFALAPLQRAAERLAERAVPIPAAAGAPLASTPPGKEEAYRTALRAAMRDRALTREEEIGLAHLSDELGLTHKRAREIWHEVASETAAP